jgi:hypothetical protein
MSNKTVKTNILPIEYINSYTNQKVILDCLELVKLFKNTTGHEPVMWGKMIGFGSYHYKYASGREGDWFIVGFAPSKVGITIYTNCYFANSEELLARLGKHKKGKSCLYIKELKDLDLDILEKIIIESFVFVKAQNSEQEKL